MECSAKEMLSSSLGDRDPECRVEAIKGLALKDPRDFKYVLKLAHHDQDLNVQREAIRRLADDMPYNSINLKERIDLIERIIAHPEEEIRNLLGPLLYEWISQAYYMEHREEAGDDLNLLCSGTLYLLNYINFLDNEQMMESALFGIFDYLLNRYQDFEGEDAILAFAEAFANRDSACINRTNYKKLLNMK